MRAVECMDCLAVLTAEDDAGLVDALGKHYVDAHRRLPITEDKIREQIAAQARDASGDEHSPG